MNKAVILFLLLAHFTFQVSAQWEGMEMDVYQGWGSTSKVNSYSDDGSFFFHGFATAQDTNSQLVINGWLFSTYNQGVIKNRVLVNNPIRSVVEFQGDTILAGSFNNVRSIDSFPAIEAYIERVLVLNNGSMQQLGSFNASCWAKVIGDNLYIFGLFSEAMGNSCHVIKWDGEQWEPIGPPILASHHEIRDIAYYNDELYIAGNIIMNNGLRDILVLRDGEWQEVGETIPAGIAGFEKLVVYKGELYAAGTIRKIDGFAGNMIQRWNGEIWQEVGNSLYFTSPNSYAKVWDMKVHEGFLYVSGVFLTAGGIDASCIARWDGSQWCGLNTQNTEGMINSFAFSGDELYVRESYLGLPVGSSAFIHRYTMGDEVFPCSEVFTGLDDEAEVAFSIHPNPTSSHLTLTGNPLQPGTHITAYNLTGQQVYAHQLNHAHEQLTLDARQFGPAGMYLLHIETPGQTAVVKKVVVQE